MGAYSYSPININVAVIVDLKISSSYEVLGMQICI